MIEIRLPKCRVFLTEQEIGNLLKHGPELWKTTLKRSKVITRRNSKEGDNEKMRRKMPKLLEYSMVMAIVWVGGVCSWMILQYLRAR